MGYGYRKLISPEWASLRLLPAGGLHQACPPVSACVVRLLTYNHITPGLELLQGASDASMGNARPK